MWVGPSFAKMLRRMRREEPRTVVGRRESICSRVLMMSRGWTIMVEMRPAERPATLGDVSFFQGDRLRFVKLEGMRLRPALDKELRRVR